MAKALIVIGILLVLVGTVLLYAPWLFSWFGKLPGDIRIELHPLLVGIHVAIEPFEIFDFIVGFIGIDPMEDTF